MDMDTIAMHYTVQISESDFYDVVECRTLQRNCLVDYSDYTCILNQINCTEDNEDGAREYEK